VIGLIEPSLDLCFFLAFLTFSPTSCPLSLISFTNTVWRYDLIVKGVKFNYLVKILTVFFSCGLK
jgi:hypothetical protein